MIALLGLFLVLSLVVLAVVVVAGVLLLRALRGDSRFEMDQRFPGLRGAWAITERTRAAAVAVICAVAALGLLLAPRRHGLPLVLAPALGALCALLLVDAGQRLVGRRLAGAAAGLETRRVRDYVPRRLSAAVAVAVVLLVAALATSIRLSDPDGRGYSIECSNGGYGSTFLGSYYAWPLAVLTGLLLVGGGLSLRHVASRPRNGTEPGIVVADDETRRRAATAVVATVGIGVAGSLLPLMIDDHMLVTSLRWVAEQGGCGSRLSPWVDHGLEAAGAFALVLGVWCAARLLVPGSRRPVPVARELVGA